MSGVSPSRVAAREVGSALEQDRDRRGVAVAARLQQRRDAEIVGRIRVGAGLEQQRNELGRGLVRGPEQCRRAIGLGRIDVGTRRDQLADRGDVGVTRGGCDGGGGGLAGASRRLSPKAPPADLPPKARRLSPARYLGAFCYSPRSPKPRAVDRAKDPRFPVERGQCVKIRAWRPGTSRPGTHNFPQESWY